MKKWMMFFGLLTMVHFATAQEVSIGSKANYQVTKATIDGVADLLPAPDWANNFNLGIYTNIDFGNGFSVQPELLLSQKGFIIREEFPVDIFDFKVPVGIEAQTRIKYLEMPLMARYSAGETVKFFVEGGPVVGFAVDADLQERAHFLVDFNIGEQDLNLNNDLYNRWEVGGAIGGGITIPAGKAAFDLGVRYQHSFTDLLDDPIVDVRLRNHGIAIGAGVRFYL